jgi:hypothetical protein
MILKIENKERNGYFFFEAEEVEYRNLLMTEIKEMEIKECDYLLNEYTDNHIL